MASFRPQRDYRIDASRAYERPDGCQRDDEREHQRGHGGGPRVARRDAEELTAEEASRRARQEETDRQAQSEPQQRLPRDEPHDVDARGAKRDSAGDTFAYDADALATKAERERLGADRIFGLLPAEQAGRFRALWEEFEAQATPEARFANALDRLQPLLQNAGCGGGTWRTYSLTREAVLARMDPIRADLPSLWPTVVDVIDAFCAAGVLR